MDREICGGVAFEGATEGAEGRALSSDDEDGLKGNQISSCIEVISSCLEASSSCLELRAWKGLQETLSWPLPSWRNFVSHDLVSQ